MACESIVQTPSGDVPGGGATVDPPPGAVAPDGGVVASGEEPGSIVRFPVPLQAASATHEKHAIASFISTSPSKSGDARRNADATGAEPRNRQRHGKSRGAHEMRCL